MARISNEPITIKMKLSRLVSTDGINISSFLQGTVYTVTPDIAKELAGAYDVIEATALEEGDGENKKMIEKESTQKNMGSAPNNKMSKVEEKK